MSSTTDESSTVRSNDDMSPPENVSGIREVQPPESEHVVKTEARSLLEDCETALRAGDQATARTLLDALCTLGSAESASLDDRECLRRALFKVHAKVGDEKNFDEANRLLALLRTACEPDRARGEPPWELSRATYNAFLDALYAGNQGALNEHLDALRTLTSGPPSRTNDPDIFANALALAHRAASSRGADSAYLDELRSFASSIGNQCDDCGATLAKAILETWLDANRAKDSTGSVALLGELQRLSVDGGPRVQNAVANGLVSAVRSAKRSERRLKNELVDELRKLRKLEGATVETRSCLTRALSEAHATARDAKEDDVMGDVLSELRALASGPDGTPHDLLELERAIFREYLDTDEAGDTPGLEGHQRELDELAKRAV